MRRMRRSMRGTGRVGCAIWLVIFIAIVYILAKVVPVKMRTSQFYDAMQEQASFGSIKGNASIQNELFNKAHELNLPLRKEDIQVVRDAVNVRVEANYTIEIHFIGGYTYSWNEHRLVVRPLFAV